MQREESLPPLGAGRRKELRRISREASERRQPLEYVWGLFLLSGSCLPLAFLWEVLWLRGLWVEWLGLDLPTFAGEGTMGRCLVGGLGVLWELAPWEAAVLAHLPPP